jgi:hypothetical protein
MKPFYSEQDLHERLLRFEQRYGLSSEEFLRLYEKSGATVAGEWVYLTVPRYGLWAVSVADAFVWAGLCHRLGIGGGD